MFTTCTLSFLSTTAKKRSIFDQLGEEGLKGGIGGGFQGSYAFTSDPREIFSQFFGGQDPFEMFGGATGGTGSFNFGGKAGGMPFGASGFGGPGMFFGSGGVEGMDFTPTGMSGFGSHKPQDPPIEHSLNLTLEELYQGCTKKMKISRKVVNPDGITSVQDKVVSIDVKPGWKAGTKITFAKEGDQYIGRVPADIVFIVREKPHPHFKREGNDLIYTVKLSLRDALCGAGTVQIPTIDKRFLPLQLNDIVTPTTVSRQPGEGMPNSRNAGQRGDLVINFDVQFPTSLPPNSKEELSRVLP